MAASHYHFVMPHGPTPEAGGCYWVSSASWFNQACGVFFFFSGSRGTWDALAEGSQADCWLLGFDWFCFSPHNGTKFMGRHVTERDWPYCPETVTKAKDEWGLVICRTCRDCSDFWILLLSLGTKWIFFSPILPFPLSDWLKSNTLFSESFLSTIIPFLLSLVMSLISWNNG